MRRCFSIVVNHPNDIKYNGMPSNPNNVVHNWIVCFLPPVMSASCILVENTDGVAGEVLNSGCGSDHTA